MPPTHGAIPVRRGADRLVDRVVGTAPGGVLPTRAGHRGRMRWLNYLRVPHGGLRVVAAGVVTLGSRAYFDSAYHAASGLSAQPLLSRWLAAPRCSSRSPRPSWSCA